MGARTEELAGRFEAVNADLLALVEPLSDEHWFSTCDDEGATIAAVVSHVGGSYRAIGTWIGSVASGEETPSITRAEINAGNERLFDRHARRPKDEALDAYRRNAAAAAERVRALTDDELTRSRFLPHFDRTFTVDELVEQVLIGHPTGHLASLRKTLGQE